VTAIAIAVTAAISGFSMREKIECCKFFKVL